MVSFAISSLILLFHFAQFLPIGDIRLLLDSVCKLAVASAGFYSFPSLYLPDRFLEGLNLSIKL